MMAKRSPVGMDEAETLGAAALEFLSREPSRLVRFMSLTGLQPEDLIARADTRDMQAALIEHLLADESLLLVFAAEASAAPERIAEAHAVLTAGHGTRG